MATDIRAELKNCGVSAQKTRLVIDLVRGKPAVEALTTLKFTNKVAARHVRKLLASAIANAEENFGMSRDDLLFTRLPQTKLQPENGAVLVPADVSNQYCGVHLTSQSCCARKNKFK